MMVLNGNSYFCLYHEPNTAMLTHCSMLIHWGRVTHICVSKLSIIGSDNGLSPDRRQAIIWTNAGILLIGPLGTNFSEILIAIEAFSFRKMHLKISSAKWRLFGLGVNELTHLGLTLFCRSPPGPIWEIEGFVTHICVTREIRAVFQDAYMRHQAKMRYRPWIGNYNHSFCGM